MSVTEIHPGPDSESRSDPSAPSLVATAEVYTRAHPRAAREERHLGMLREMQDDNMCIQTLLRASAQTVARREAIAEQSQEDPPQARLEAIGRAHANMGRATRLLMLTEIQIDEARIARLEGNIGVVKAERDEAADVQSIHDRCTDQLVMEVRDVVETMIQAEVGPDTDRADLLLKGLYGALNVINTEDGFTVMAIGQVAARICGELGLTPDWDDWADQDWARYEAECEMPGSPYCPQPRVVRDADGRYRFSSQKPAAKETGPP